MHFPEIYIYGGFREHGNFFPLLGKMWVPSDFKQNNSAFQY